eukprot:TRINITY_DN2532_c0_g2_i27.p1 TRINITY_DN2532_c0_g2~~TRINITY_DN2532_c0_g2_i27.p1  ORF type:complete len:308 (+),score=38.85 TRINITY_DN2532_c0_g2_i27:43-966(+)
MQNPSTASSTATRSYDLISDLKGRYKEQESIVSMQKVSKTPHKCLNLPAFGATHGSPPLNSRSPVARFLQSRKESDSRYSVETIEQVLDKNSGPMMAGWIHTKKTNLRHLTRLQDNHAPMYTNLLASGNNHQSDTQNHSTESRGSSSTSVHRSLSTPTRGLGHLDDGLDELMFLRRKLYQEERASKAAFVSFPEYLSYCQSQHDATQHSPQHGLVNKSPQLQTNVQGRRSASPYPQLSHPQSRSHSRGIGRTSTSPPSPHPDNILPKVSNRRLHDLNMRSSSPSPEFRELKVMKSISINTASAMDKI